MGLPAAVLPPTNQLLEEQLRDIVGTSNSSSSGNSTWEKLVDDAAGRPGSSIMLLLRHSTSRFAAVHVLALCLCRQQI